ncbi:MAG: bifunctional nicotinamidase/pyrazinamidase [Phycisphaerae bacterium]
MKALILVDIQNDFLPGGALAVPNGDQVIAVANRVGSGFDLVLATQDWHPPDHGSFAANHPGTKPGDVIDLAGLKQVLWPIHCVQDTPGADLAADLNTDIVESVIQKGTDPDIDSYSGFFDNGHRKATGLADHLRLRGVARVYVMGLATDYCVQYTVLDACRLGFDTHLIVDGCRGVELTPGDTDRAVQQMQQAGARIIRSEQIG